MKQLSTSMMLIGCLTLGCAARNNSSPENTNPEKRNVLALSTGCQGPLPRDPYEMGEAEIAGDTLRLQLHYGGGCSDHTFVACWDGGFLESDPPQARVEIHHDAHGDACEAYLSRTLSIDLTALKKRYQKTYRAEKGAIALRLGDQHRAVYHF